MRIALIDPFYDESHRVWAEGFAAHSSHDIDFYVRPARHWKWKLTAEALLTADRINSSATDYDLILCTDMVNVPLLKSKLKTRVPIAMYFHENQITYPWSERDQDIHLQRDHHYGWINFSSALITDCNIFNSNYHKSSFLKALPSFLRRFPRENWQPYLQTLEKKSLVLPVGLDLPHLHYAKNEVPVFLWNHRWEYDKNPASFFDVLYQLKKRAHSFQLIICGRSYSKSPSCFAEAERVLSKEIIHFGYVGSQEEYHQLLSRADIIMHDANQDFFGISTVEAIAAGSYPLLPNRLSYPEHIPQHRHDRHLFDNREELVSKLSELLSSPIPQVPELRHHIEKYSWDYLRSDYDKVIENIVR